jgi:hypothetical protein
VQLRSVIDDSVITLDATLSSATGHRFELVHPKIKLAASYADANSQAVLDFSPESAQLEAEFDASSAQAAADFDPALAQLEASFNPASAQADAAFEKADVVGGHLVLGNHGLETGNLVKYTRVAQRSAD